MYLCRLVFFAPMCLGYLAAHYWSTFLLGFSFQIKTSGKLPGRLWLFRANQKQVSRLKGGVHFVFSPKKALKQKQAAQRQPV